MKNKYFNYILILLCSLLFCFISLSININARHSKESKYLEYRYHPSTHFTFGPDMKLGMSNSTVESLYRRLILAGYLKSYTPSKRGNYMVYDKLMENAVKHFQKDIGVESNGIVTPGMYDLLDVWNPLSTSVPLGFRKLDVSEEIAGKDVDVLVSLLDKAGFSPQKDLLKQSKMDEISSDLILLLVRANAKIDENVYRKRQVHYYYNEEIQTAVKVFQAYNGIKPTGELTKETLEKLKTYNN